MRATFRSLLEAKRLKRAEETGESGFSLIELIVVVVIIGILVAIAIPIFLGVEHAARMGAVKAAATDGATAVAGVVSENSATMAADIGTALTANSKGTITVTDQSKDKAAATRTVDNVCVKAVDSTDATNLVYFAGPGAAKDGSACN